MPPFLKKFFPVVYKKTQETGLDSNYCKYDNEGLQLFTSSLYLAALTATLFASITTRKLGRKLTMLIAGIFFLIGTILNAAAINIGMLIAGRLLLGCGVGFANQVFSPPLNQNDYVITIHKFFQFGHLKFQLRNRLCQSSFRRLHQREFEELLTYCSSSMSPLAFFLQTLSTTALPSKSDSPLYILIP